MYHTSMTLKEALKSALTILKQVMEEKLTENNIEICTVATETGEFKIFNKEEMLKAVEDINKQTLEQNVGMSN